METALAMRVRRDALFDALPPEWPDDPLPALQAAVRLREETVRAAIVRGVCKLNVNTEVRAAYVNALRRALDEGQSPDLLDVMSQATAAMCDVVAEKLHIFGSCGRV